MFSLRLKIRPWILSMSDCWIAVALCSNKLTTSFGGNNDDNNIGMFPFDDFVPVFFWYLFVLFLSKLLWPLLLLLLASLLALTLDIFFGHFYSIRLNFRTLFEESMRFFFSFVCFSVVFFLSSLYCRFVLHGSGFQVIFMVLQISCCFVCIDKSFFSFG